MDLTIGQRIKERRRELKITGSQIKEKTGISTGNLSEIENGKVLPSSAALIQLAQILDCSTDYILFGSAHSNAIPTAELPQTARQLLTYFQMLTADDQEELLMIAQIKASRQKNREKNL